MSAKRGFSLIELLVVTSIIAVLSGMLLPAVKQVREAARRTQCLSSLRQTGIAMQMYLDDQGGWYPTARQDGVTSPTSQKYWFEHLMEYLGSSDQDGNGTINANDLAKGSGRDVLKDCPNRPVSYAIYPFGYGMNACLKMPSDPRMCYWNANTGNFIDYNVSQVSKRPMRALVGDGGAYHITVNNPKYTDNWAPTRHGKVSNYLFCDLHVQGLDRDAAAAALSNPGAVPPP